MNISIVDDAAADARELRSCLLKWADQSGFTVRITEYKCGRDFLKDCSAEIPAIVFMDIYMNEENGFEVISQLRKIATECITIFITSSCDDALRAFSLHPFDYVVKPWSEETIFRVMTEAAAICRKEEKFVEITIGRQKTQLAVSKIGYAISDNHHVHIVTVTGEQLKSFSTFTEISEELVHDRRFLVCNRGIIVNMDFVDKSTGKCFVMKNGDSLPLKVKEVPILEKTFAEYIFDRTRRWEK